MAMVTAAAAPAPSYDYDAAFRLIAAVQRAATDPGFHAGVLYAYTESGRPGMAARFTAAVEESRVFTALEAEFGDGAGELVSA